MQTEVHREERSFEDLRDSWRALVEKSACGSIFVTWEWQATWWKHLGEGELHLLTLRTDGGELVGIAPLCRVTSQDGEHAFRWIGCVDVSDYLDVIALPGYERALYDAILDYLTGQGAPAWDYVDLCNIPQSSPTYNTLTDLAAQRDLEARSEVQDVCPYICLPGTWDAYLDSLDKKQRHEIRRKMRRVERETEARWYVANEADKLDEAIDAFIDLHKKSDPEKEAFMTEQMVRFFHDMGRAVFDAGWLKLAFLEVNGEQAAAMLNFDYRNGIFVYNSGYDPNAYATLSTGIVLLSYCIQDAIEARRARFDFLRGDEEYKFRFGAVETTVHNLMIGRGPLP